MGVGDTYGDLISCIKTALLPTPQEGEVATEPAVVFSTLREWPENKRGTIGLRIDLKESVPDEQKATQWNWRKHCKWPFLVCTQQVLNRLRKEEAGKLICPILAIPAGRFPGGKSPLEDDRVKKQSFRPERILLCYAPLTKEARSLPPLSREAVDDFIIWIERNIHKGTWKLTISWGQSQWPLDLEQEHQVESFTAEMNLACKAYVKARIPKDILPEVPWMQGLPRPNINIFDFATSFLRALKI